MGIIRLVSLLAMGWLLAPAALAQVTENIKHRDELLEPSKGMPRHDRRDDQRLFDAARDLWHGENGHVQNREKAVELFRLAARNDYPPALYYLSRIYFVGEEEVRRNERLATDLLKRADRLGLQDAETRLLERNAIRPRPVEASPVRDIRIDDLIVQQATLDTARNVGVTLAVPGNPGTGTTIRVQAPLPTQTLMPGYGHETASVIHF